MAMRLFPNRIQSKQQEFQATSGWMHDGEQVNGGLVMLSIISLFDLHQAKQTKTKVLYNIGSSWARLLRHSKKSTSPSTFTTPSFNFQIEQTKENEADGPLPRITFTVVFPQVRFIWRRRLLTSCSQIIYTSLGRKTHINIFVFKMPLRLKYIIL